MAGEKKTSFLMGTLSIISVILGLLNLLQSSMKLDEVAKELYKIRRHTGVSEIERMDRLSKLKGLAWIFSISMLASCLQILFCGFVFICQKKKASNPRIWMGVHLLIFLVSMVTYALETDSFDDRYLNYERRYHDTFLFVKIATVNWIFCLVAPFILYDVLRRHLGTEQVANGLGQGEVVIVNQY